MWYATLISGLANPRTDERATARRRLILAKDIITYFVDGEEQVTEEHKLTVAQILENAGFTPATDYILTRQNGHHDFTDYNQEVPLRNGERFTTRFIGVTPTSRLN